MVCWFDPSGINTVQENIALWQRLSRFEIEIMNFWPGRGRALVIPQSVDMRDYAGVIVHCTVSYWLANLRALDGALLRPLEQFDGLKVLMKQDEQRQVLGFASYLGDKRFDLVITCVPEAERSKVYRPEVVGGVTFLHALTGYVSPLLRSVEIGSRGDRSVDISYRGSLQPLEFGRLGFEKRKIGDDVACAAGGLGLTLDDRGTEMVTAPADLRSTTSMFSREAPAGATEAAVAPYSAEIAHLNSRVFGRDCIPQRHPDSRCDQGAPARAC
jgi:hypothetical protein